MLLKTHIYRTGLIIGCFSVIFLSCSSGNSKNAMSINDSNLNSYDEELYSNNNMYNDYEPAPLNKLIGVSELIITGHINKIIDSNFVFTIEEKLYGKYAEKTIVVKQYIPSKFDGQRRIPYAVGQSYILFLQTSQKNTKLYDIIGYQGEGEMPVESGYVYILGTVVEDLASTNYTVYGSNCYTQRFDFEKFKDAILNYHKCFDWQLKEEIKNNKVRKQWIPALNCDQDVLKNYESRSWIHQYLVQQTLKSIPKEK